MSLLEVSQLSVAYRLEGRSVLAVRDVSLSVARGEVLGLVGESGCGKSSLLRAVLALVPFEGSVRFDGVALETASAATLRALRPRFQPVFQDPSAALDPLLSVEASLVEALGPGADGARVAALLARVQLAPSLAARRPHELSAGQKQRVSLARALARAPELLLLDEPVSALDVSVQAQVLALLAQLKAEQGLAMLFVSHDLDVIGSLADRVGVMYAGRLVELGPAAQVLTSPRHPYTEALTGRTVLEGEPPSLFSPPPGCAFAPRCPLAQARCRLTSPPLALAPHASACFVREA
jgi:peptide/nickel transport system ATP-binding protein